MDSFLPQSLHLSAPPPPLESNPDKRINPSILLIIVILAVIFFISGLLHLLVRFLLRPNNNREPEALDQNVTALQGQLQQLFQLHDSGVDQSFIDTLPVFLYKAIIGLKVDPFDCAVCLSEFEPEDRLRLLSKCSHAFHLECIDTWLLAHSTCPLCRGSLIPEFSPTNSFSPLVFVLESGSSESSREIGIIGDSSHRGDCDQNTRMGFLQDEEVGEIEAKEEILETKVVQVKLGKYKNLDVGGNNGGEGSSGSGLNSNLDQRRCFSMGSYEYVMNETSILQVAIRPSKSKTSRFKKPGITMSECDCYSRREGFKGFDTSKSSQLKEDGCSSRIGANKRESFSVSKIWLRSKKDKPMMGENSSRRALSFRLPLHHESTTKAKSSVSFRTETEFEAEKCGSEMDLDVEIGSCTNNSIVSLASQIEEAPSFARRTMLWIVGKQNKVGSII